MVNLSTRLGRIVYHGSKEVYYTTKSVIQSLSIKILNILKVNIHIKYKDSQYSYIGQSSNIEYFREDCLLYIYFKTTHHKKRHKTVILLFLCMPDYGCKNLIYFLNMRR